MKKIFKLLLVLIVVIVAAALAAPYFIPAEQFKSQIVSKVEAATGRTLAIDGALHLRLFPNIGVTAENVTLSNPQNFAPKTPFATIKTLDVDVALMPLLSKQIEVKHFTLDAPVIALHVNASGVKNWEFSTPSVPSAPPTETKAEAKNDAALAAITLGAVEIKNGSVSYLNDTDKSNYLVEKLNTKVSMKNLDAPFSFSGNALWNGKTVEMALNVSALKSLLDGSPADVNVEIESEALTASAKGALEKEVFTGNIAAQSPSLKQLQSWLAPKEKPIATPAPLALNMSANAACNVGGCSLSGVSLALDHIKATGNAKIGLVDNKPSIDLMIATGILDINPFLAPETQPRASIFIADALADAGRWSEAPMDLSSLRAANVNARIATEGVVYRRITIGKTPVALSLQNGKLSVDIEGAALYSGTGAIHVDINSSVAPPAFDLGFKLDGVDLQTLLKDADITDRFSGLAHMNLQFTTRGNSQKALISALGGSGSVRIDKGDLKGVNLVDMLHNVGAAFGNVDRSGQHTLFSDLSASFSASGGIITNRDLSAVIEGARVTGHGDINLPGYTLLYRVSPQVIAKGTDAATGAVVQKEGLAVPVIIEGSLDNPTYRPDVGAVLRDAINDPKKLKEQLKNSKGALKEQLKNPKAAIKDVKGLLNGLR